MKEGVCGELNYKLLNYSIEEILKQLPALTPAQVYNAFSFYYDHQEEIEKELKLNREENWWSIENASSAFSVNSVVNLIMSN